MKPYVRTHPEFSLCGLPCGLCPKCRTEGSSRCPGCGGEDFHEKHPSCGVISCSLKHGGPAFCAECPDYPCARYQGMQAVDSFVSYAGVRRDLDRIQGEGAEGLLAELAERMRLLDLLINHWDDGRSKGFYCLAAQLLPPEALADTLTALEDSDAGSLTEAKDRARVARTRIEDATKSLGIALILRKPEPKPCANPEDPV